MFTRICQVEVAGDGIVFDLAPLKIEEMREEDKHQGIRLDLQSYLDKAEIAVQADVGFGDHVYPAPDSRTFPSLLPDLPGANVLIYPPETVVSEKFEAMIRFSELNGRAKDFHDIWVTT